MYFSLVLNPTIEQHERLFKLQTAFAALCNELAPFVSDQQCWNRVTLHHLKYKEMRLKYPEMGSQMVCNAIYAVSKISRLVYQHPSSPYNIKALQGRKLPTVRFSDTCPVYFDSHTLTVTNQQLSMFTMDGRIKFELVLTPQQRELISGRKLLEITLSRGKDEKFMLSFYFEKPQAAKFVPAANLKFDANGGVRQSIGLPEYVGIEESL